ncbi:carbon-nitrogen hydrolase [Microthyrium microscopicum]|uniref:Carbon-nitrogen hydrolase n=1 Tax=Microthyrium microscopicum TaxID=703497 RepID=A0A6A6UDV3_9PEZI|nr:carbon-nitrogen hydrolase [Microthyrium microscopicum]
MMPRTIRLATAQSPSLSTVTETLAALRTTALTAARSDVALILFPEAYLGHYPRQCTFGSSIGSRTAMGREQYLSYYHGAVDLGDTQAGDVEAWARRQLPTPEGSDVRGDGTREELERVAAETGLVIVSGVVERAGSSLFCSIVCVDPIKGMLPNKRRKVMPTGTERLVWAQGDPATLKAMRVTVKGVEVTIGMAVCWENFMPLLRYALYKQGVDIWLAPTADARDGWQALMRTIAMEGRAWVVSSNQVVRQSQLPSWVFQSGETEGKRHQEHIPDPHSISDETSHQLQRSQSRRKSSILRTEEGHEICIGMEENVADFEQAIAETDDQAIEDQPESNQIFPAHKAKVKPDPYLTNSTRYGTKATEEDAFVCRGGSLIVSPMGDVVQGPLWEAEGLLIWDADMDDCVRGKLDFDAVGHYARGDAFELRVRGLDLVPPP